MKIIDVKKILNISLPNVSDFVPGYNNVTFTMTAEQIRLLKDWAKTQSVKKSPKKG